MDAQLRQTTLVASAETAALVANAGTEALVASAGTAAPGARTVARID
jgi:hypothetical protein